ncbi:MAG: TIGR04141 family sporadically distributed protein [Planctomycetota bacterium]
MITGQLRSRIDKLWEEFWTGGVTNPLTVIEQISFLMFARLLDMRESTEEKKFDRIHRGKNKKFPGVFQQHLRWSQFKHRGGDEMLKIIRDERFPHFRNLGSNGGGGDDARNTFSEYMKDATLMIQKPSLLVAAVNMIDELPLTQGDTKAEVRRVPKEKPKLGSFKVVFAVMGKFKGGIADSLPFFSKMSLMSVAHELGERGVEVAVTKIETR